MAFLHEGRFDPDERLAICEREGIGTLCQAPTEYRILAKRTELRPVPSLRRLVSAGEPLNPEVMRAFREAMGLEIHDGYGQTETGALTGSLAGIELREGSMGMALPGIELRDRRRRADAATRELPDLLLPLPRLRPPSGGAGGGPATWSARTRTATCGSRAAPTT